MKKNNTALIVILGAVGFLAYRSTRATIQSSAPPVIIPTPEPPPPSPLTPLSPGIVPDIERCEIQCFRAPCPCHIGPAPGRMNYEGTATTNANTGIVPPWLQ